MQGVLTFLCPDFWCKSNPFQVFNLVHYFITCLQVVRVPSCSHHRECSRSSSSSSSSSSKACSSSDSHFHRHRHRRSQGFSLMQAQEEGEERVRASLAQQLQVRLALGAQSSLAVHLPTDTGIWQGPGPVDILEEPNHTHNHTLTCNHTPTHTHTPSHNHTSSSSSSAEEWCPQFRRHPVSMVQLLQREEGREGDMERGGVEQHVEEECNRLVAQALRGHRLQVPRQQLVRRMLLGLSGQLRSPLLLIWQRLSRRRLTSQ